MPRSPGCSPPSRTIAAHAAAYSPPPRRDPLAGRHHVARPARRGPRRARSGSRPSAAVAPPGPRVAASSAASGSSSPTSSSRSSAAASAAVRIPASDLERGERAEDLGLGPVVDVVAATCRRARGRARSPPGSRPRPARRDGCTWMDSACSAASTLSRNGSRPPNRAAHSRAELAGRVRGDHRVQRGPAARPRRRRTAPTGARPSTAPPRARRSGRAGPGVRRSPCAIPTRTAA